MAGALARVTATIPKADEPPELIVDGDYRPPPPLDPRIASVWLRTMTNNPTEGYEVAVSAAFGKERIKLKAGEFELETEFSLMSANIELNFVKCEGTLLRSSAGGQGEGWTTTRTEELNQAANRNVGGNVLVEGAAGVQGTRGHAGVTGKVGGERSTSIAASTHQQQVHGEWNLIGPAAIRVGRSGKMLDGTVIADFAGWRVSPKRTDEASMVMASVVVREDWIKFENVEYLVGPPQWGQRLRDLLQLSGERQKRKEAFILLLRHLAQTELRRHQRGNEAVIAVSAINVKPASMHAVSVLAEQKRGEICIPSGPLETFLASEEGHEESTLVALGVDAALIPRRDMLAASEGQDINPRRPKRGDTFIPEGSPVLALDLLAALHMHQSIPPLRGEPHAERDAGFALPGASGDSEGRGLARRQSRHRS